MIMRRLLPAALLLLALTPLAAEKEFDVDGPMELHIWLTAKAGHEADLEKTFREVFYPAVSSMKGFRSAAMMRKPGTAKYTVRLSFATEEARMDWVASDKHQKAWPALAAHAEDPDYDGFAVVHPK